MSTKIVQNHKTQPVSASKTTQKQPSTSLPLKQVKDPEVKIESTDEPEQAVKKVESKKLLKDSIKEIVRYAVENFGRVDEDSINVMKAKYENNKQLGTLLQTLISKFASTTKTKEEMVKYSLRRALKFIKGKLSKQKSSDVKEVSKTLCDKYFKASEDEIQRSGSEETFLKGVLPFRYSVYSMKRRSDL